MDGEENKKTERLESFTRNNEGKEMTTNTGVKISNDENSLTVGDRGPTLLEDFLMREKLSHFDRERIPERVVHARGYGAHGVFELYESLEELTMANFLRDPSKNAAVRFSEVAGSKGANETNRDVRGFAVKFYTEEGNFDLVGNNIPIFSFKMVLNFPILFTLLNQSLIMKFHKDKQRTIRFGISSPIIRSPRNDDVDYVRSYDSAKFSNDARLRCSYIPFS